MSENEKVGELPTKDTSSSEISVASVVTDNVDALKLTRDDVVKYEERVKSLEDDLTAVKAKVLYGSIVLGAVGAIALFFGFSSYDTIAQKVDEAIEVKALEIVSANSRIRDLLENATSDVNSIQSQLNALSPIGVTLTLPVLDTRHYLNKDGSNQANRGQIEATGRYFAVSTNELDGMVRGCNWRQLIVTVENLSNPRKVKDVESPRYGLGFIDRDVAAVEGASAGRFYWPLTEDWNMGDLAKIKILGVQQGGSDCDPN